jgi:methionyl-tRNA synthetase
MNEKKFYITTTLPYVNSKPHMGHALEFIQADTIARYHKELLGEEVVFNTGTDEHGQKVYEKALEAGKDVQTYTDENAATFKSLIDKLELSYTHFIRTTNPDHKAACQEFWKQCLERGDIYKKNYKLKYCVGCELEKTDSELVDGRCSVHPHLELVVREEENYFFRFSKYGQPLLDLYATYPDFVVPSSRFNEIKEFVKSGLEDFSVSRLKEKMPWGVSVPGDDDHVMYVWFDALINYISTLGWTDKLKVEDPAHSVGVESGPNSAKATMGTKWKEEAKFEQFWGTVGSPRAVQIAGKDNLRQQSAMWQAMLLSAGLPTSRQIIIHGFIISGGQKMSKSVGNVLDPMEIVDQYGAEALRYFLLREISTFEDGDFTMEKFTEAYNAGLANGVGNLVSRILKMARNAGIIPDAARGVFENLESRILNPESGYTELMNRYELHKAADWLWGEFQKLDEFIAAHEPYKTIKLDPEKGKKEILFLLERLAVLTHYLKPFLPETSGKILKALEESDGEIPRLFPRIQ